MQRPWFQIGWPLLLAILAIAVAFFVSGNQIAAKFNSVDRKTALWNIQPGLGTVMIEYGNRFNAAWWAADGDNWDMVRYQLKEMPEIQEVAETTRPARADALKKFEADYLEPMVAAAQARDKARFVAAYDRAITGCNQCHADQSDDTFSNFRFIRIVRPTSPASYSNVEFKLQGQP
jgi:hypothetical protein